MAYSRKQLEEAWGHEDKSESGPSRRIFLELLAKAKQKDKLSYAEAEYLCNALSFTKMNDGKPQDFEVCRDYLFRHLYLRYAFDLNGVTPIKKSKNQFTPIAEKRIDVEELEKMSQEWEVIIQQSNHPNQALNYLAKEARSDIKDLEKQPEFNNYGLSSISRLKQKTKSLWQRK